MKRIFDIFFSLFFLIILSPLILFFCLLIFLSDFKNPIFKQKRFGYEGKYFWFYKLRSMPVGTKDVPSHDANEVKITLIGKIIRRTSIDELPQLFNILIGDMSVVGPRPCILSQKNLISLRCKEDITSIRPGLTGWSQVNAYDGMPDEKKIEFDIYYKKNKSFIFDIKIIILTFFFIFKKQPVY
jgi:O-antigen biosynthesis protein WbqP